MILDIFITLFLVLLNGFFVAAEFAIVKVRNSQLQLRISAGSKLATIAKKLTDNLDEYLSATQLGITLASLGLGWIGEPVVAGMINNIIALLGFEIDPALAHKIALPIAFVTITVLHIVFGELAPKSMAIQQAEAVSLSIAIPLRIFYFIFKPFIWVLNSFANMFIRMIGFHSIREESELHSSDELRYLIKESTDSGVIELSEHKLLENIFEFSEIPVKQIMVPRGKIFGIEISIPPDEIVDRFIEEGFSRVPVYKNTIDNIIGVIYAKDFITMLLHSNLIILNDLIRPAFFVNEDEKINILLTDMQRRKYHIAIVLDEFGGTAGLVSLEDIIEEIVGEIQDEYDHESPIIIRISDNEYSVSAHATIDDANEFLPEPLPDADEYETVGGLVIYELNRIPELNEVITIGSYSFKITKRTKRSIETICITYLKSSDNIVTSE